MRKDVAQLGRVGVLMGGCSSEREISFKSGKAVLAALVAEGCPAKAIEINSTDERDIENVIRQANIDLAFITLHGKFGEDGAIQSLLERLAIPYTGSDAASSRRAINKIITQTLVAQEGVVVPPNRVVSVDERNQVGRIIQELGGVPVVLKPPLEGSSIGITIVLDSSDIDAAVELAFQFGPDILIEKYIPGKELTAGLLDGQALPLVEIRPKNSFFDFEAKYQKGMSEYIVPTEVDPALSARIQASAVQVSQILGCADFVRMDFILGQDGQHYFLEANTIPGFTATSLLPMAAKEAGCSFGELCLKIAGMALRKKDRFHPKTCCSI